MARVKKMDGKIEPFSRAKIIRGCKKSGASKQVAERVARQVYNEVKRNKIVSSARIRKNVLALLRRMDNKAYKKFVKFRKKKK